MYGAGWVPGDERFNEVDVELCLVLRLLLQHERHLAIKEGRCWATWKRKFKLELRKAGLLESSR